MVRQGLDLALGGGGVDAAVGTGQADYAAFGHGWVIDRTVEWGGRGDTEWIPPPHLDHGQPRINTYHHPEKLLQDSDDEDPEILAD